MKKIAVLVITVLLLFGLVACKNSEDTMSFEIDVENIDNLGNLGLPIDKEFLFEKGYEYGDVFKALIDGEEHYLPFVENYNQVGFGECVLCTSPDRQKLTISINMMSFASNQDIATSHKEENIIVWELNHGDNISIVMSLYEKGGYLEEYREFSSMNSALQIRYERSDYSDLSDEEYANFRMVDVGNIKDNILYRGNSPYKDNGGRADIVNEMLHSHGINRIVSLELEKKKDDYVPKYYEDIVHTNVNMGLYPLSDESYNAVREAVLFINGHDGPYYVNCAYGRDRTGIFCMIIEALMGADIEKIKKDYDLSFRNLYDIELSNHFIEKINETTVIPIIKTALWLDDPYRDDLREGAIRYLHESGLTDEDINTLIGKLS